MSSSSIRIGNPTRTINPLLTYRIADDGVAALASALRGGALPACTTINLDSNQIGDDGVAALASALRGAARCRRAR